MTALAITSPYPQFFDLDGSPLDGGKIYFGREGLNPFVSANQLPVFWDAEKTQPAAQPLKTMNGYVVRMGTPAQIFTDSVYSLSVYDRKNRLVSYSKNASTGGVLDFIIRLASSTGAALVGFIASGFGAVPRTVQGKLRDTVSVDDFGAVASQDFESTEAFKNASLASDFPYIPDGLYLVDTESVDISVFNGPGRILSTNGNLFPNTPISLARNKVQRKLMEPFFGFNNGTTSDEIYTGAGASPQGIAKLRVDGVDKLYVLQRPSGSNWTASEVMRIVEFNVATNGAITNPIAFSNELHLGHQGFSGLIQGGVVYLYSAMRTVSGHEGTDAGKGFTKTRWRGALTDNSDVTSYQLWGYIGSGHKFERYNRATSCVSADGRYIVLCANDLPSGDIADSGQTVFIYDRKEVESAADPLLVDPIYMWTHRYPPEENLNTNQGVACDGRFVYILRGNVPAFSADSIQTYDLAGQEMDRFRVDGVLGNYTLSDLLDNSTMGIPTQFEPEGIALDGDDILLMYAEAWRNPSSVVSYDDRNWAAIDDNVATEPFLNLSWVRTGKAASSGAWNSGSSYTAPTGYTRRAKVVMAVGRRRGISGEQPLQGGNADAAPGSQVNTGGNATDISFKDGSQFQIRSYTESGGKYRNGIAYDTSAGLSIYDCAPGAENTKRVYVRADFSGGRERMEIRSRDGGLSNGAGINLYGKNDSGSAGKVILSAYDSAALATKEWHIQSNGTLRANADATQDIGTAALRSMNVYANRFRPGSGTSIWSSGSGSPEGVVSAVVGSMWTRTDGTAGTTLYVKELGTGNTGWTPK